MRHNYGHAPLATESALPRHVADAIAATGEARGWNVAQPPVNTDSVGTHRCNGATSYHNRRAIECAFMLAVGIANTGEARELVESGAANVKRRYDRFCRANPRNPDTGRNLEPARRKLSTIAPEAVETELARVGDCAYARVIRRLRGECVGITVPLRLTWRGGYGHTSSDYPVATVADVNNGLKAAYRVIGKNNGRYTAWERISSQRWDSLGLSVTTLEEAKARCEARSAKIAAG